MDQWIQLCYLEMINCLEVSSFKELSLNSKNIVSERCEKAGQITAEVKRIKSMIWPKRIFLQTSSKLGLRILCTQEPE